MIHALGRRTQNLKWIAAADEDVTGLEAEPDIGDLEDSLDLPRSLHEGSRLGVEGRLVTTVATTREHRLQADLELLPVVN